MDSDGIDSAYHFGWNEHFDNINFFISWVVFPLIYVSFNSFTVLYLFSACKSFTLNSVHVLYASYHFDIIYMISFLNTILI